MANIVKYQEKYQEQVYNLFVDFRNEEDFFKEFTYEGFCSHLFKSSAFNADGTFVALEGDCSFNDDLNLANKLAPKFAIAENQTLSEINLNIKRATSNKKVERSLWCR